MSHSEPSRSSLDYQCLTTLSSQLQSRPGRKLPSSVACDRRASVAIILRSCPTSPSGSDHPDAESFDQPLEEYLKEEKFRHARLELLYIVRARSPSDRWSGHVAFPGGRCHPNESDQQAAERETKEEIGLTLARPNFVCLGALDDRTVVTFGGWKQLLTLGAYVYLQTCPVTPPLVLDTQEVELAYWVPLEAIFRHLPQYQGVNGKPVHQPLYWNPVRVEMHHRRTSSRWWAHYPPLAWVLRQILGTYDFHCLALPMTTATPGRTLTSPTLPPSDNPYVSHDQGLRLWGLTLQMTSDLVDRCFTPKDLPRYPLSGPPPTFGHWEVKLILKLWYYWSIYRRHTSFPTEDSIQKSYHRALYLAVLVTAVTRVSFGVWLLCWLKRHIISKVLALLKRI
ncbi:hypothetical protein IWQ62_004512 [Dispira parvispora]|uniref:Nudix hydrolase domain-containing protein n=1 Tax=Dispira parvispora TaxID=1520584 RepID=A0A9W8ALS6_9FUNG|nr:hypothetical protein IWQ62_004512 [Dispira parvispora]